MNTRARTTINFAAYNSKVVGQELISTVNKLITSSTKVLWSFQWHTEKKSVNAFVAESARAISTAQLCCFQLYTYRLSTLSSPTALRLSTGGLILRWVSHLDAFSAYPLPAWLPGSAPGGATGRPAAGPSRSSRTKDRTPQTSCARNR